MAIIDNLIAYYPFDESSGNAEDAHSVGPYDLTHQNDPGTGSGVQAGARDFVPASTEAFYHADNTDFSAGDVTFSWAGWIRFDTTGVEEYFLAKWYGASDEREYLLARLGTDRIIFAVSSAGTSGTVVQVESTTAISSGTWYFVAGGHNATANDIWVSVGAEDPVTTSHSAGVFDGTSRVYFGNLDNVNTLYHDGLMDEWGFWKRDIRSDLSWIYNTGSGRSYADIVAEQGGATPAYLVIRKS
jgi:hypothetical protein